jgi:hypothetical protein
MKWLLLQGLASKTSPLDARLVLVLDAKVIDKQVRQECASTAIDACSITIDHI